MKDKNNRGKKQENKIWTPCKNCVSPLFLMTIQCRQSTVIDNADIVLAWMLTTRAQQWQCTHLVGVDVDNAGWTMAMQTSCWRGFWQRGYNNDNADIVLAWMLTTWAQQWQCRHCVGVDVDNASTTMTMQTPKVNFGDLSLTLKEQMLLTFPIAIAWKPLKIEFIKSYKSDTTVWARSKFKLSNWIFSQKFKTSQNRCYVFKYKGFRYKVFWEKTRAEILLALSL